MSAPGVSLADALLRPRSVALVGASDKPGAPATRPLRFLRTGGYAGRVYPVRADRSEVQGERCWPSLDALPEVPDHVYLLGSQRTVLEELARCVRAAVPVVTILASGFAEAGEAGAALERQVLDLVRGSKTRLLGPSSLGMANFAERVRLTANAALDGEFPAGSVLAVSHSGSLLGALASRARARGDGFAAMVSVGSEIDLTMAEICRSTLDDPRIQGYVLFLEHLAHAPDLRAFAQEARARGKAVVAYKLGRTAQAARMAATHTGAIVGSDDLAQAFLAEKGIPRVHHLDALLPTVGLATRLADVSRDRSMRIGVVSTTGGGAAMLVDELGVRGVQVTPPSRACLSRMHAAGIVAADGDVVDLTLAGTKPEVMRAALTCMLEWGELDLVVTVLGSSAVTRPEEATEPIVSAAHALRTPLAVLVLPEAPRAVGLLRTGDVPAFTAPELCADGIAAVLLAARRRRTPAVFTAGRSVAPDSSAAALLEAIGIPAAPEVCIPLSADAVPELPFGFPVAVKALDRGIAHKTEIGGVILDVKKPEDIRRAMAELRERLQGIPCAGVQIQPMVQDGLGEVLVGLLRDAEVGPVVTLAPGGALAELAQQRSVRLAPVSEQEAMMMIEEVGALRSLSGYRGRPRGDLQALAHAVHKLSLLALQSHVRAAEVNPLIVRPEGEGVVAVDFLLEVA